VDKSSDHKSSGFFTANPRFFDANDPLVLQYVPGAIQFSGMGAQKGDSVLDKKRITAVTSPV
jgi:hypothetical protein